ncbi:hypothetical protein QBC35DRAFT_17309 [Podospora australis]|uniref:Uncharacterized protein n=1 Tax=Podospora australis TaxID=1536484 RepID=A0AAN6WNF1_9PEZI|nr:hypothetical protein QBC35DRAFT_17309 [Podospora australis]
MGNSQSNPYNPQCTFQANNCLNQVIGFSDNNGPAQFSACTSAFGSPIATSTVTPPPHIFSSFVDVTVYYTDSTISASTTTVTEYETLTSWEEVVETVAHYSGTSISTVTEVVTATPTLSPVKRRRKRGGCRPKTSTVSTTSEASTSETSTLEETSIAEPSVTETPTTEPSVTETSATETSATETSSIEASTSSAASWPIAPNCPSYEEYSSACSCIYAESTATRIVSASTPVVWTTITYTVSSAIAVETSTSVVTSVVTSTEVAESIRTVTVTTTGLFETTTTVT